MTHHHTSCLSTPKQSLKKLTLLTLCTALPLLATGCATSSNLETSDIQTSAPVVTEQAQALYEQGLELFNGEDTAQNKKQAFKLFHQAAKEEHTDAQGMLANMYASGQGVIVDYKEAAKWAHKAAEKGHFEAQFMLGIMYRNGKGVAKDRGQAIKWLEKAVEKGDPNIQVMLGTLYFEEEGSDNKKRAVKLFQSASDQDNAEGHFALGVAYGSGIGIAKNEELSGKLIKKAAKKNSAGAQIILAKALIQASGMENNKKAVYWLQKAADSGNFKAKIMLDKMKEGQLTVKTSE